MRHDRFIGPHHYWIRFHNGTHEVRETEYNNGFDPVKTRFTGRYEDCVKYIDNKEIEYLESLF